MEKIESICVMRDLCRALAELEKELTDRCGVSLNEAMTLCCVGGDTLTAGEISELTGFSASHASKVIRSLETKGLLVRRFGEDDRRRMRFTLSEAGAVRLRSLKETSLAVPDRLKPLFG